MKQLEDKIKNKNAKIGIIGMGYVGIPLGLEFSNKGFFVLGFISVESACNFNTF